MAVTFNEASVGRLQIQSGVYRQRLLEPERVKSDIVRLNRLQLAADAAFRFEASAKSLAWLHLLDGTASFNNTLYTDSLSATHSVLLPPGLPATLSTANGACLLYAEVPDAGRLDPGFSASPPLLTILDWTREPVLKSKSDARKRVELVTPEICNTAAIRIQMVIYPPGTSASRYHHEGAESFVYVLSGCGKCWTNERPFPLQQGDLVYFADREPHYLAASQDDELRFLVIYAPGIFKTIWADQSKVSAWVSTDRDINGYSTAENERQRRAATAAGSGFTF